MIGNISGTREITTQNDNSCVPIASKQPETSKSWWVKMSELSSSPVTTTTTTTIIPVPIVRIGIATVQFYNDFTCTTSVANGNYPYGNYQSVSKNGEILSDSINEGNCNEIVGGKSLGLNGAENKIYIRVSEMEEKIGCAQN